MSNELKSFDGFFLTKNFKQFVNLMTPSVKSPFRIENYVEMKYLIQNS